MECFIYTKIIYVYINKIRLLFKLEHLLLSPLEGFLNNLLEKYDFKNTGTYVS